MVADAHAVTAWSISGSRSMTAWTSGAVGSPVRGREGIPSARTDVARARRLVQRVGQAVQHVARQGIHRIRTVERDLHDAVFDGFQQVGHRRSPGLRIGCIAVNVSQSTRSRNGIRSCAAER